MGRTRTLCIALGLLRPRDPKSQPLEGTSAPKKEMVRASMLGMDEQPSTVEEAKQTTIEVVRKYGPWA